MDSCFGLVKVRVLKDAIFHCARNGLERSGRTWSLLATPTVFKLHLYLSVFHTKINITTETILASFQINLLVNIINLKFAATLYSFNLKF